jgi:hypothetical protein
MVGRYILKHTDVPDIPKTMRKTTDKSAYPCAQCMALFWRIIGIGGCKIGNNAMPIAHQ